MLYPVLQELQLLDQHPRARALLRRERAWFTLERARTCVKINHIYNAGFRIHTHDLRHYSKSM